MMEDEDSQPVKKENYAIENKIMSKGWIVNE